MQKYEKKLWTLHFWTDRRDIWHAGRGRRCAKFVFDFFQNDPLTNFMHICREILRNFREKLRKLFFLLCDFALFHIFCGACHSMSTVKIWEKNSNRNPLLYTFKYSEGICRRASLRKRRSTHAVLISNRLTRTSVLSVHSPEVLWLWL